ncbi:MAG: arsenite methyltransferase [Acidimicrobiia bacterium]
MTEPIKDLVAERYGSIARAVLEGKGGACCGTDDTVCSADDPITRDLYDDTDAAEVPTDAINASLGCGNPTALASLTEGQTVLDLGSGGGIDVLLSARRVGPTGFVYGLDMTDEMLELARKNQAEAGATNVEFLKGDIEDIPLPDGSVDRIISNCVINLSVDKPRVFAEAFRVLKPGGQLAVSDIVVRGDIPHEIRRSVEAWIGCVAGALDENDFRSALEAAGFVDVSIEPTRVYEYDEAKEYIINAGLDLEVARAVEGRVLSAFVRATKP